MLRSFQIIRAPLAGFTIVRVALVGSAPLTTVMSKRSVYSSKCLVPSLQRIPFQWMPSVPLLATQEIEMFKRRTYHWSLPTCGGGSERPPKKKHEWNPKFDDIPDLHHRSKLAIRQAGLKRMTEIQSKVWPHALAGRDIIGRSHTGTGKSIAFLLPSLERVLQAPRKEAQVGILILSPTRELAIQTAEQATILTRAHGGDVTSMAMIGGTIVKFDMPKLKREGVPTILVATPGRLLGHLKRSYHGDALFSSLFKKLQVLVIDEADVMLSMGFRDAILEILSYCPPPGQRQTLLFSATLEEATDLAQHATKAEYTLIDCVNSDGEADASDKSVPIGVQQSYAFVPLPRLFSAPIEIIVNLMENSRRRSRQKIIAFFPTIKQVKLYEEILNNHLGRRVFAIHSELGQNARTSARNLFQLAHNAVLLTTDASARGVDYKDITHVVQFGIANDRKTYIHRLGRTGRAGKSGNGLLVLTDLERPFLEKSLKGLGLVHNAIFQSLLDGPMNPSLEDEISQMAAEIRDGNQEQLKRRIYETCDSVEAFYKTRQADLKDSSGAKTMIDDDLLGLTNSLLNQAGILSRFRTRMAANQTWIPGESFGVGITAARNRHRDNQHRRHADSSCEDAVENQKEQKNVETNELGAHNVNAGASVNQKRTIIPESSTTKDGGSLQASDTKKRPPPKNKSSTTKSEKIAAGKRKAALMKSTVDASFVEGPYYDWFSKRHPRKDDNE